jgi:zinc transport system ATP-binding protein
LPIVEVENLNYKINNITILKNISFSISRGDYIAVVGPNGGGKSTLINTILGLKKGWNGKIKLFGKELAEFKDWQKIGFVPQRVIEVDAKFPITVLETIKLGRMKKFKRFWQSNKDDFQIIDEVMESLKISDLKDKLIGELSGGQKQRVMIARALVSEPELLFLDEPNTGVDAKTQRDFYKILQNLNRKKSLTIIFITHDIGVIEDSITSLISINREILKSDEPRTIFNCQVMREVYGIDSHLNNHKH